MMTIIEFLEARIAEDEAEATERGTEPWYDGGWAMEDAERLRKDCAAKRAIIEACREDHEDAMSSNNDVTEVGSAVLYALAAAYPDHPDYREEWRP